MFVLGAVSPDQLGTVIRTTVAQMRATDTRTTPQALLYAEKRGGFSCRTCLYVVPRNATHGDCTLIAGISVHLDLGCCAGWDADPKQLQLYQEPQT